jgi:hypothetical protein
MSSSASTSKAQQKVLRALEVAHKLIGKEITKQAKEKQSRKHAKKPDATKKVAKQAGTHKTPKTKKKRETFTLRPSLKCKGARGSSNVVFDD